MHFRTSILLFSILLPACVIAQPVQEANPYYLGHSLVNLDIPAMVHGLAVDAGKISAYDYQIGIGANLSWQYTNPGSAQGTPYTTAFPVGNHDVFIVTEAVPLQNHLTWSDTYQYATDFLHYAINNNDNLPLRYYIYETWHCTFSGIEPPGCAWDEGDSLLWHPRLLVDWPLWTGIADHVRQQMPDQEVWMIPAGQAFHALTTLIEAGSVPGISSFEELFSDDIHLTNKGNYFVACIMYACIYRDNPGGLSTALQNEWGTPYADMPTAQQAAIMQQVAWNTVLNLSSYSGVEYSLSNNLFSFNASKHLDQVVLRADLASFHSAEKVEISHSKDAVNFMSLTSFDKDQISDGKLEYTHDYPVNGDNYYRLEITDLNRILRYSPIEYVNLDAFRWQIFPNPVTSTLNVLPGEGFKFKLFDTSGRMVSAGNSEDIISFDNLDEGLYLLLLFSENNIERHRIIHIK